jgi:hypothetical protein
MYILFNHFPITNLEALAFSEWFITFRLVFLKKKR